MTRELFWLTLTVILTGLLWVPYIINRCQVRGLSGAMANPSRNDKPQADWANRLMFAHDNAVENLIIFAPLVLILNDLDYSTKWTVMACAVYFWSRVAHLIVYTIGLPVFRTLAFTVGFLAQAVLALAIFKMLFDPGRVQRNAARKRLIPCGHDGSHTRIVCAASGTNQCEGRKTSRPLRRQNP